MTSINYQEKAEREILMNDLIRFAERIRERWPSVASIIYGAEVAVKMRATLDAAKIMARFSKTLIDEKRKKAIEPELQVIQLLMLRAGIKENSTPETHSETAIDDTAKIDATVE